MLEEVERQPGVESQPLLAGGSGSNRHDMRGQSRAKSAKYLPDSAAAEGIALTWEDVCYSFAPGRSIKGCFKKHQQAEQKLVLNNVSGAVLPGQLLAIMGASGSGKTTLLDVLAGRQKVGTLTGRILINGRTRDKYYKRQSGYVTQDDCLNERMTVYETLMFYAQLKLPSPLSQAERRERVNLVIEELGLEKVRDSIVGGQFARGISGGEKKRLSIGCELITDPSLIFLDEPTTGLDSYNSLSVMDRLSSLAAHNRAVVCTIHQPRSTIFQNVDQLMILSQGEVVYTGPSKQAVSYFSGLNFHIKPFINPADFLLDAVIENQDRYARSKSRLQPLSNDPETGLGMISTPGDISLDMIPVTSPAYYIAKKPRKIGDDEDEEPDCSDDIADDYCVDMAAAYRSTLLGQTLATIQEVKEKSDSGMLKIRQDLKKEYASNWFKQFFILSLRNLRDLLRNPMSSYVIIIQTIFMALLVGSIYFDLGLSQSSIQNRLGALFFVLTNQSFGMLSGLNLFLQGRNLFNRERASGVYCTSAYFLSKLLVDLPSQIIVPVLFLSVAYWLCGFQSAFENFGTCVCILVIFALVAGSLYLLIGTLSPNMVIATIISPIITVLFLMFGGFYINIDNIPIYYKWIYYISFFRYSYEALLANEFRGLQFACNNSSCIPTGEVELQRLGMADVNIWENVAILAGMAVAYRLLAYFCLRFLYKEKR